MVFNELEWGNVQEQKLGVRGRYLVVGRLALKGHGQK